MSYIAISGFDGSERHTVWVQRNLNAFAKSHGFALLQVDGVVGSKTLAAAQRVMMTLAPLASKSSGGINNDQLTQLTKMVESKSAVEANAQYLSSFFQNWALKLGYSIPKDPAGSAKTDPSGQVVTPAPTQPYQESEESPGLPTKPIAEPAMAGFGSPLAIGGALLLGAVLLFRKGKKGGVKRRTTKARRSPRRRRR